MPILFGAILFGRILQPSIAAISTPKQMKLNGRGLPRDTKTGQRGLGKFISGLVHPVNGRSGQAWAILGFIQTYNWTKDPVFLDAAQGVSDFYIKRLNEANHGHPYVPLWDFDAPTVDGQLPPRDTSSATCAATGLLKLHQILKGDSPYLKAAVKIISQTIDLSYPGDPASFTISDGKITVTPPEAKWDSLFMNATENNNEFALTRSNNTGIVYADYYFLEFGNALLEMGFV